MPPPGAPALWEGLERWLGFVLYFQPANAIGTAEAARSAESADSYDLVGSFVIRA